MREVVAHGGEASIACRRDQVDASAGVLSVLAETAYPPSVASARVRVAGFEPFLRREGIALTYCPSLSDSQYRVLASDGRVVPKSAALGQASLHAIRRRRPEHDLLLVHRLRLLNPLPWFDPPRSLDVYDLDDALFVRFRAGVNRRAQWAKQEQRRCVEYLRRARLVLAGNSFLADGARPYARRIEVMPSCVDPTRQPLHVHEDRDPVAIGWIGSPTTSPYLAPVLPVLARLNSDRLRARLILVGADRTISAPWIEHHQWSIGTESALLASFDIGIIPQPDTEWARGKCGYKVLQYFAAGIPAVGSPVGITANLIGPERGVLAATTDEWHRALMSLISDPARRAEQGAAARRFVETHYSYQRWAPDLGGLLRSVAT